MKEWDLFISQLERELGPERVKKWLPSLLRFDAANIYLEAKDSFQLNWFEEHIRPRLKGFVNNNQRPIKVHIGTEKKKEVPKDLPKGISFQQDPLDPDMTLDHFIPSESNLIAYKLLTDTVSFNPIYFFGPRGSGKTHLLMGASLELKKKGKKVFFVRAETFTEHVVQAIRLSQMQEFRKVYRDLDALIIDDIHIFAKKTATQEEFFHTFNTLHTLGLPILISANAPPHQLQEIEPRLISRFEWGISLEIGKSDPFAILKKKALLWKFDLSDELAHWLIEKFSDPVLPLQALLLRSKDFSPSIILAEKLLQDLLLKEEKKMLTPERIIKTVAIHYGILSQDLLGKGQTKTISLPRQIAMYVCREKLKLPFQKIGEIFGRDHSTVMGSIRQIEKSIEENQIDLKSLLSLLN